MFKRVLFCFAKVCKGSERGGKGHTKMDPVTGRVSANRLSEICGKPVGCKPFGAKQRAALWLAKMASPMFRMFEILCESLKI